MCIRFDVRPLDDWERYEFYTLAGPGGEFMLASPTRLDWPLVARDAVLAAGGQPASLEEVAEVLIARHSLKLVRAPNYYNIGTGCEHSPPTFGRPPAAAQPQGD